MTPHLSAFFVVDTGKERNKYTYEGGMSQTQLDAAAVLVGNGLAEIEIGQEDGIKDYGNGVSAYCSVRLTVNQDTQTIQAGINLAGQIARYYVKELLVQAKQEFDSLKASLPVDPNRG